jgi:hypothetical protein
MTTWGKNAWITAEIAGNVISPTVGPVVQYHVDPPRSRAEYSQRVVQDQQHQWAEWDGHRRERESQDLGKRPNPAHLPGRDPKLEKGPHRGQQGPARDATQHRLVRGTAKHEPSREATQQPAREAAKQLSREAAPQQSARASGPQQASSAPQREQKQASSPQQSQSNTPQQSQSPAPSAARSRSPSRGR